MLVRVLGAHKLEDRDARHTCFLIDSVLAIDAGSLASSLNIEEQSGIKAVLVTHCHFDHIRDLPTLGLATLHSGNSVEVFALPETLDAIHDNVLNTEIYPDLTEPIGSSPAKYIFRPVREGLTFKVLGYEVETILMAHTVPNLGFIVRSEEGGCIGYTGDTGGGLSALFQVKSPPQVLFVDVSFPDRLTDLAMLTGHLTPSLLRRELMDGIKSQIQMPQIVPVHVSQYHEDEIAQELRQLSVDLEQDLILGFENMKLEVRKSGITLRGEVPAGELD